MKRYFLPVIQILVTGGLLWWIFRNPAQNRKLLEALQQADLWWFLPGIAAMGAAILLQTERWLVLLRVQNIVVSRWRALKIVLVGAFFNMFFLGATGGDIVKIFFIMRETPDKKAGALLSVFIDRVIGMLALAVVSAAVILARWQELMSHPLTQQGVAAVVVILGGMIGFILVAWMVDRMNLSARLPAWLPMHAKIAETAAAFAQYARAGNSVGKAFLLSVPGHLLIFSGFYFGAKAFGAKLGLLSISCVMPIVAAITALPISVGGAGLREGIFIKMLGALYGTPEAIATLISISGFLMGGFWSLIGGVIYLLYRSSDHATLAQMKDSVQCLEHEIEERETGTP